MRKLHGFIMWNFTEGYKWVRIGRLRIELIRVDLESD